MFEAIKELLRTKIWSTDSIYIDGWSILHFIIGYILYSKFKLKPYVAISIIIIYELIEPVFTFFRPETPIDIGWDIIIGIAGYYTARRYLK